MNAEDAHHLHNFTIQNWSQLGARVTEMKAAQLEDLLLLLLNKFWSQLAQRLIKG